MKNRTTSALLALALVAAAALAEDKPETPEHVTGDAPYPFDTVDPREEEKEPIELPGDVADKLELLTDDIVYRTIGTTDASGTFTGKAELRGLEDFVADVIDGGIGMPEYP